MEANAILADEVLKASALLYFKDALVKQEYESCAELIGTAKQFGAAQGEINDVIAAHLQGDKAKRPDEASQSGKNRLRALKEEK